MAGSRDHRSLRDCVRENALSPVLLLCHLSSCSGRASMVVTSNRDTSEWLAMFDDVLLAQSAVDRFKNTAYDFVMEGESYRPRLKPKLEPDAELPTTPVNKPKVHPRTRGKLRR